MIFVSNWNFCPYFWKNSPILQGLYYFIFAANSKRSDLFKNQLIQEFIIVRKILLLVVFSVLLYTMQSQTQVKTETSHISVVKTIRVEKLNMPWQNCIAVGRANNLLRADLLKHLEYAQQIMGYRYCRFHAIFLHIWFIKYSWHS